MTKYPMYERVLVDSNDKHQFVIFNCGKEKYLETYENYGDKVAEKKVCIQGFNTIKACKQAIEIHKITDKGEMFTPTHPRWKELMW